MSEHAAPFAKAAAYLPPIAPLTRPPSKSTPRPAPLAAEAYYGLAGDWWRMIEPHTEASAPGVIVQFLVAAGNVMGRGPNMLVALGEYQRCNEFCLLVGDSGSGAKGTSGKVALLPFEHADRDWWAWCIHHAANSSLGVIDLVRDRQEKTDPDDGSRKIVDEGCIDPRQRALFRLSEFASLVKKFEVKGDTLSATYRDGWDGTKLANTSKTNRASATNYHLSLVGHVTRSELLKVVDVTEQVNGFLNRHLLVWTERSKVLVTATEPDPTDVQLFCAKLRERLQVAQDVGDMQRDPACQTLYAHVAPDLVNVPRGLLGALLERGRQHVLRLAMIYALLDDSIYVRVPHLLAGLAVWDYSAATFAYVFGDASGDPQADRVIRELVAGGGTLTRTELSEALGRNWPAEELDRVVDELERAGRVHVGAAKPEGRGRPETRYSLLRASTVAPILPKALAFVGGAA